jgi:DNA polymerase delta subunit 1
LFDFEKKGPPMKESLTSSQRIPIFRMYGVNEAGNSLVAHLYGYVPYLYCNAPVGIKNSDLHKFVDCLNQAVRHEVKQKEVPSQIVLDIKLTTKENVYGFHGNKKAQFLMIEVVLPRFISMTKRVLESGFEFPGYGMQGYHTYESNIDFEIRFMADFNIVGCNWIEIPAGLYKRKS